MSSDSKTKVKIALEESIGFKSVHALTKKVHIARHKELHAMLDELAADYVDKTGEMPSGSSITDLMQWSFKQIQNPDTEHISSLKAAQKLAEKTLTREKLKEEMYEGAADTLESEGYLAGFQACITFLKENKFIKIY